jgi:hypothetical protein
LLDALASFARALDLDVRIEPFVRPGKSAGGLCLLRGRRVVLIDASASVVEQDRTLAEALVDALGPEAALAVTQAPPPVREALRSAAQRVKWRGSEAIPRTSPLQRRVSVLRRPKPGLRSVRPKA